MINPNKHTAIILLWIFAFPIFSQSIHIVRHHSHDDGSCLSMKTHFENFRLINKHIDSSLSETKRHCPVCEYKFPVNNLHKISIFKHNIFIKYNNYINIVITQVKLCILSKKSPRAPPCC